MSSDADRALCSSLSHSQHQPFRLAGTHSASLLRTLNELRESEVLTDVSLVADSQTFHVHKVVMASASDYFRAMFTTDMREKEQQVIELHGITAKGLRLVIEYIYTSEVPLEEDNVRDVLDAASHLQVLPLLEKCKNFMLTKLSSNNCLAMARLAEAMNLDKIEAAARKYCLRTFGLVIKTKDFLELSIDKLLPLLESDDVLGCTETGLFLAALKWLEHDPCRQEHASQLMSRVRFPLMPPGDLVRYVQSNALFQTDEDCKALLMEASRYHNSCLMQPVLQSTRTQVRTSQPTLLVVGGTRMLSNGGVDASKDILCHDPKTNKWNKLTELSGKRSHHSVAVLGNFLYVVGGQDRWPGPRNGKKKPQSSVLRYDPVHDKWFKIASMNQSRMSFFLGASVYGRLFAVGGIGPEGRLASVESYDPETNEWSFVTAFGEPRSGHAGAELRGKLYISGGGTESMGVENTVLVFDPSEDEWAARASMYAPRDGHQMVSLRDRLFVFGGVHYNGHGQLIHVHRTECYDPDSDQWTNVKMMPFPQCYAGAAVLKHHIFMVGGFSWLKRKCSKSVQQYDGLHDNWVKCPDLPEFMDGVACATLFIPTNRKPSSTW
ncbi:kelch-like protein 9 [Branchiostoma lanceolatum]|uniref:kelch-like protein 9 n=1 Tax=Branchiostoma lanceolatum TaxID=7740 RepID=UPI003454D36B